MATLTTTAADTTAATRTSATNDKIVPDKKGRSAALAAAAAGDGWRLTGATVVVTLEPCPMCAGAIVGARAARVVFGAPNPEAGAMGSLYHLGADPRLNHEFPVRTGVRRDECAGLLQEFFAARR